MKTSKPIHYLTLGMAALLTAGGMVRVSAVQEEGPPPSVPAVALKEGLAGTNCGDVMIGYQFTAEQTLTVTALGLVDWNRNGKLDEPEPVQVAIWDVNGTELRKAEIPLTASAENGAFYVEIEPFELPAGSYVIGTRVHKGGEPFGYDAQIEVASGVRWDEGRFDGWVAWDCPKNKRLRSVLWHQGESDSLRATSAETYAQRLGEVISQSRRDVGWDVPWGVALASYHPEPLATEEKKAAVIEGQKKAIATVLDVFEGPSTNSYHAQGWIRDGVHFNEIGLAAYAAGWAKALTPLIKPGKE